MSQAIVAGPQLLEFDDDFIAWLETIRSWEGFLRTHNLQTLVSGEAVSESNRHGHWPTWEGIRDRVESQKVDISVADIVRLFAVLANRFTEVAQDGLVLATSASGCLGSATCDGIASEICAAALSSPDAAPIIAGATQAETEELSGTILNSSAEGADIESRVDVRVACAPLPRSLLECADPSEWIDVPLLAMAAVRARLDLDGVPDSTYEVRLLPSFLATIRTMPRNRRADALRTLILLSVPPPSRPRGIKEHGIRVGRGPGTAQLTSQHGQAFRATLSTHGPGWRLHYWRSEGAITASLIGDHDTIDIPD